MNLAGQSIRAVLALFLGACNSASMLSEAGHSNPKLATQIKRLYEARDACLEKNAVPSAGGQADVASLARAISLSCSADTERLVAAINPSGDPRVSAAILRDTDARSVRYMLLARSDGRS